MKITEFYQKIYNDLIQKRKSNPISKKDQYCERHHIIPRCMNGSNDKENTVNLTAREHFIAHMLLARIFRDTKHYYKLLCAITYMTTKHGKMRKNSTLVINSRTYDIVRNELSRIRIGYFKKMPLEKQKSISETIRQQKKKYAKQILCIETGIIYESLKDAVRKTGISRIRDVCKGRRITAGGFHFKYLNENIAKQFIPKAKSKRNYKRNIVNKKPVYCLELNKTYESLFQCALSIFKNGSRKNYIREVLNGKRESYHNLHFKWVSF